MLFSVPVDTGNMANHVRPGADMSQYRLSPNDHLEMKIYLHPDLTQHIRVEADGTIKLPLIGKIKVGGLTVIETQEYIQILYNEKYLVNPQVTLFIAEFRERRIQVMGQVNKPGPVLIPLGEKITLTEAIAAASGFNLRAKRTEIQVTRKDANGNTVKVLNFNVKEILKNPKELDPVLQEGDTVFVRESVI